MASARPDGDPRRANRIVEFQMRAEEADTDLYPILALLFGFFAIFLKIRFFAWATILCVFASFANMKHSQADTKGMLALGVLTALAFLSVNTNRLFMFPSLVNKLLNL